jgi:hypothetical protein
VSAGPAARIAAWARRELLAEAEGEARLALELARVGGRAVRDAPELGSWRVDADTLAEIADEAETLASERAHEAGGAHTFRCRLAIGERAAASLTFNVKAPSVADRGEWAPEDSASVALLKLSFEQLRAQHSTIVDLARGQTAQLAESVSALSAMNARLAEIAGQATDREREGLEDWIRHRVEFERDRGDAEDRAARWAFAERLLPVIYAVAEQALGDQVPGAPNSPPEAPPAWELLRAAAADRGAALPEWAELDASERAAAARLAARARPMLAEGAEGLA